MGLVILYAICFMMIIEGAFPLVSPAKWREIFAMLISLRDGQIRTIGLISVVLGLFFMLLISANI